MALRQVCGNALSAGGASGYFIRSFVAASRTELRKHTTVSRPCLVTSQARPWRATTGSIRHASTGPEVEQSSTSEESYPAVTSDKQTNTASTADSIQAEDPFATTPSETSASTLPWYLQVSPTPPTPSPLSNRQRLPPLPPTPPPLLTPILSQLSIDLGLDDLSLLDLRTLDPPAALGANLIMLLATARSEKHLHVSADRLCRWLRTTHSLRPFADGLLGRNELKLRQKRKAKRVRLLSSVGAKTARGADDAIRTGWVCVNVGLVEGGVLPREEVEEEQGYVGFRSEEKGCRIVVQMLTDEKRGELDLESLWTGIKNRAAGVEGSSKTATPNTATANTVTPKTATPETGTESNPFPEAQTITA